MKKTFTILLVVALLALTSCGSKSAKEENLEKEVTELKAELERVKSDLDRANKKLEEAQPWFDMSEQEKREKQKDLEEKLAEQKAKEEAEKEAAQAEKEKEEKMGYETGITYEQLARTPDNYKSKKVKFTGRVVQVMEGDDETQIRLAADSNYDTVLYCGIPKTLTNNNRVLEDDIITIYGTSYGLLTYNSTMGGKITIPAVIVDKFER